MKRVLLSILVLIRLTSVVYASVSDELGQFFHGEKYETILIDQTINNNHFFFSYIEASPNVYRQGVIHTETDLLLILDANKISTPCEVLFQSYLPNFFGWRIDHVFSDLWITTTIIQSGGEYVTDGPSFFFDETKHIYKLAPVTLDEY